MFGRKPPQEAASKDEAPAPAHFAPEVAAASQPEPEPPAAPAAPAPAPAVAAAAEAPAGAASALLDAVPSAGKPEAQVQPAARKRVSGFSGQAQAQVQAPARKTGRSAPQRSGAGAALHEQYYDAARQHVFTMLDASNILSRTREQVRADVELLVSELTQRERLPIAAPEQAQITADILNDMFGIGPIEPLLQDDTISDIMVNGPDQVYIERRGRLELTPLKFRDNAHLTNVVQRIAASIGRRVDETSPMVDARLVDGSRVNVVMPPLALDGVMLSIRKFSRNKLTLPGLAGQGSMSLGMSRLLQIAAACRLNVVISGGAGSGKTTLLNAMSQYIDAGERIVTIEDAAELQLQQPHVVRMETRPPNLEGLNAVTQGDLVRNALRMRPDRIILGETRGGEAFDVLQAMNTGHDGSMTTLHANTPRDALIRLESMVMMANANLPLYSIRRQVASAIHMIVQVERMRDGGRRVTHIVELAGMEGDVIVTQDLFRFNYDVSGYGGSIQGSFDSTGLRPLFTDRARTYGLEAQLMEACRL